MHAQAEVTDIALKTQSLLAIQKGAVKPRNINNQDAYGKQYGKRTYDKPSAYTIEIGSLTLPTRSSQHH